MSDGLFLSLGDGLLCCQWWFEYKLEEFLTMAITFVSNDYCRFDVASFLVTLAGFG